MFVRPRPMFGGLIVAVVLSVAACGGGTATKAPTAAPGGGGTPTQAPTAAPTNAGGGGGGAVDAGSVLTADAAGSIIGGTVTKVPIPATGGVSLVSYTNATGDGVTAMVEPVPAGTGTAMMQAGIQAAGANGELQTFGGLGDAAGKVVNANDATVVFVKGDTLVVLWAEASGSSGSDLESKLESLARQIAGRL